VNRSPSEGHSVATVFPPKSGRHQEFSEIDRAEFFDLAAVKRKINPAQAGFLEQLDVLLSK
jgi:predicted NUDIX family NTP pyrophosphohydrolase